MMKKISLIPTIAVLIAFLTVCSTFPKSPPVREPVFAVAVTPEGCNIYEYRGLIIVICPQPGGHNSSISKKYD